MSNLYITGLFSMRDVQNTYTQGNNHKCLKTDKITLKTNHQAKLRHVVGR